MAVKFLVLAVLTVFYLQPSFQATTREVSPRNNHHRQMKTKPPLVFDHSDGDDIYNETEPPVTTVKPKPKPKKPVAKKVSNRQNKHDALQSCLNEGLKDKFDFDIYISCIEQFQGHIKPTTAWPMDDSEKKQRKSKSSVKKISYDGGFGDGGFMNVGFSGNGEFTDIDDSEDSGEVMQFYDRASDIVQTF